MMMMMTDSTNINPHNLFGSEFALGPGEHNTLVLILSSCFGLWLTRIVLKIIETRRIYQVLKFHGVGQSGAIHILTIFHSLFP